MTGGTWDTVRVNPSARRRQVPPGWPVQVPEPTADDWSDRACLWLLDLSPAEYRSYPLLRRHPMLLSWLAARNVDAQLTAARQAYARARAEVGSELGAKVLGELLATLEQEGARLLAVQREIALVGSALRGEPYVPRL